MRFERSIEDPETGLLTFEGSESDVIMKSIISLLGKASREGGEQFPDYEADMLDLFLKMLSPQYSNTEVLNVGFIHLHAFSETVSAAIEELPEEERPIAEGLAKVLAAHRDILDRSMTEVEIDAQVSQMVIPDTPADFA